MDIYCTEGKYTMMRNLMILGICIGIAVAAALLQNGPAPAQENAAPAVKPAETENRQPAPDFSFKYIDGNTYRLQDFAGRGVVLNFWASWCAPCIVEFPQMIALARKHKDTAFIFLSQDEKAEEITRFQEKYLPEDLPLNVIIAWDEGQKTARDLFQTYKLPETYLIDSKGLLADKLIGADHDWTDPAIDAKLKALSQ